MDAIISSASKIEKPRSGAAYLLFMTLRHTDNTNDDNLLKVFLKIQKKLSYRKALKILINSITVMYQIRLS